MHILSVALAAITLLAVVREGKAKPKPKPWKPLTQQEQCCQGCPFPTSCSDVMVDHPTYFVLVTGQLVLCGGYDTGGDSRGDIGGGCPGGNGAINGNGGDIYVNGNRDDTHINGNGGDTHVNGNGGDIHIINGNGGGNNIVNGNGGDTHIINGNGGGGHIVNGGGDGGGGWYTGCGGCGGAGWIKVADVNMSDPTHSCPSEFEEMQILVGKRGCKRPPVTGSGSMTQTSFDCKGNSYSEVCGKVRAIAAGSFKAFGTKYRGEEHKNIDSYYVDGVSITCGTPREHIWTYAGGLLDTSEATVEEQEFQCPCNTDGIRELVPDFVGEDYTCESANQGDQSSSMVSVDRFHADKLWDNKNLGRLETNCEKCPYFYKRLESPTTSNIDMRICAGEDSTKQELYITIIELYIK